MDVVTGAFGYIGKYIAKALLGRGREVRTITTHLNKPNPFGPAVQAFSYSFDDPHRLTQALEGADTLYNTYWIRFPFDGQTYESALTNTRTLFQCAREAKVKRIVHIGVTQASVNSPLPYYRGKALQEVMLRESGVPSSIVRPTLVFGKEDILVNNIAWVIRTCPVFPIFGSGLYRVQPVFVEDLAEIAVQQSTASPGTTVDAIGPETFTFEQLVRVMADKLGRKIKILRVPPAIGIFCGQVLGLFLRDVLLTRNELEGLMSELLTSPQPPNAPTRFSDWLKENNSTVGRHYSSEVARHFRWSAP
ncbi:MAG: NAD(P)H-binding protein [Acidobacteriia bacterium]|nr:NAD(P)H-binding protein [Terriglobia bacterium]